VVAMSELVLGLLLCFVRTKEDAFKVVGLLVISLRSCAEQEVFDTFQILVLLFLDISLSAKLLLSWETSR